jgi:hypothetical protein
VQLFTKINEVDKLGRLRKEYKNTFEANLKPFNSDALKTELKKAGCCYAQCYMAATMREVRRLQQQQPAAAAAAAAAAVGGAKVQKFRVQASCKEKQVTLLEEAVRFVSQVHMMAVGLTDGAKADFMLLRSMLQQVEDNSFEAAAADDGN